MTHLTVICFVLYCFLTDGCKKTAVVFEDVISTFDVINCQSVQAQVRIKNRVTKTQETYQQSTAHLH